MRVSGGKCSAISSLIPLARELDVVRLVVTGRTDREIGLALFLSPKTVANHVGSAMRKLQAVSRTALAVRAVEAGLVAGGAATSASSRPASSRRPPADGRPQLFG